MNNSIESYRERLKKALSKQCKAWSSGEDVDWALEWDPKPIVLASENARYQILGVQPGACVDHLRIALRIVVWPKSEDRTTSVQWFYDQQFKEKLADILNPLLPISIGWRVVFAVKPPSKGVDSVIDIARAGSMVLGMRILGATNMQEGQQKDVEGGGLSSMAKDIVSLVKSVDHSKDEDTEFEWQLLEKKLLEFLYKRERKFVDGEVITADHFNFIWESIWQNLDNGEKLQKKLESLESRLASLEDKLSKLENLESRLASLEDKLLKLENLESRLASLEAKRTPPKPPEPLQPPKPLQPPEPPEPREDF